jgi:DNA processing protein
LDRARSITRHLLDAGYTIVSGLAAGIDSVAHETALQRRGRTVAVIGTGLQHAYPPQNTKLQERIAAEGAVISQFWPETRPARQNFPLRNAVMSGLAIATVVVEATHKSGARTQVRAALAHGRPVLLAADLLDQTWAREVAARPGIYVIRSLSELDEVLARLSVSATLVA